MSVVRRRVAAPAGGGGTLAIDASTPAMVKGASGSSFTNTATTASFTPPAGSVLIAFVGVNSTGSGDVISNLSVSDSRGLTWNQIDVKGNTSNDSYCKLFWAYSATSAAGTVTASDTKDVIDNHYLTIQVVVMTGANTTAPIAQHGGGRGATGVISAGYTSSVNGSWGFLGTSDWSAQAITATGETIMDHYEVSGQISYSVIRKNSATATSGTSVTMTTSAPTSGANIAYIWWEVVPA